MRSFLFVPGDSVRKFGSAKKTAADALILDLEDSIAPVGKVAARGITLGCWDSETPHRKSTSVSTRSIPISRSAISRP